MAKSSGLGSAIAVDDSAGTPRTISNDITDFQIGTPRGAQDITGIDKSAIERILLLADGSVTLNGVFNTAANMSHAVLKNFATIFAGQVGRTITITPPGGSALSMEVVFSDYQIKRSADGKLTWTAPGMLSDGTVPVWS